jgi:succinyl-CoA synthetase alpha subunit
MLIDTNTRVLVQGLTGKEGQRAAGWMRQTGTQIEAGVTPGKGGESVDGVPVYNTVADALAHHPDISLTTLYVPPHFVLDAALEAITAQIPVIHIFAENVPTQDTAQIIAQANKQQVRVIGPSSIGFTVPGIGTIGSMGGGKMADFLEPQRQDGVAIISKSGGMANTVANMLTYAGIPQSVVIGIGGDRLLGTTYADVLPDLAEDDRTHSVVVIGEIGGAYEEVLAQEIVKQRFPKRVIAFISGLFAETLPQGMSFGHAGAIVSKTQGTRIGKIKALQEAGAIIAQSPDELISLLKTNN